MKFFKIKLKKVKLFWKSKEEEFDPGTEKELKEIQTKQDELLKAGGNQMQNENFQQKQRKVALQRKILLFF